MKKAREKLGKKEEKELHLHYGPERPDFSASYSGVSERASEQLSAEECTSKASSAEQVNE